jgi:Holliday junction resolvase - archaeal type
MAVAHRGRKSKGSKAERDLIHLFWSKGFAAMRAAGSGSSQHPSPDILAGDGT